MLHIFYFAYQKIAGSFNGLSLVYWLIFPDLLLSLYPFVLQKGGRKRYFHKLEDNLWIEYQRKE